MSVNLALQIVQCVILASEIPFAIGSVFYYNLTAISAGQDKHLFLGVCFLEPERFNVIAFPAQDIGLEEDLVIGVAHSL